MNRPVSLPGLVLALVGASVGVGLVAGAVAVGSMPGADVPVRCVRAVDGSTGLPLAHAWERRCP